MRHERARGTLLVGGAQVDVNILRATKESEATAAVQKLVNEAATGCQELANDVR